MLALRIQAVRPLAEVVTRGTHPGMLEYATFLVERGADLYQDDPDATNPLALANDRLKNAKEPGDRERFERFVRLLSSGEPSRRTKMRGATAGRRIERPASAALIPRLRRPPSRTMR